MKRRFEDSFLVRLIREFFILLVVVAVLELLIRFGTELVDFYVEEPRAAAATAEDLANDVKALMLNEGGPVAAKTMYPILKETHRKVGYEVAVVPSEVTINSIEKTFDFRPRGIPARWSDGPHHAARVDLRAEKFCTSCHVDARVGDVLGHVEVRKYLLDDLGHWWDEVQLTAIAGMGKIILHTIVLYLLLRIRMEPLNSLRNLVGRLAQAGSRVDERAPVRSRDEFGQLADDMNAFLDRVAGITADVETVLNKITSLNVRLNEVRDRIGRQTDAIRDRLDEAVVGPGLDNPAVVALRDTVEALAARVPDDDPLAPRLHRSAAALAEVAAREGADGAAEGDGRQTLQRLHGDVAELSRQVGEMAVLEERMQAIAEEGSRLLSRLVGSEKSGD